MKFYIKSYKEIKRSKIGLDALTFQMKELCGKGPFEFINRTRDGWLVEKSQLYFWHISWLMPFPKDKQYLLEF